VKVEKFVCPPRFHVTNPLISRKRLAGWGVFWAIKHQNTGQFLTVVGPGGSDYRQVTECPKRNTADRGKQSQVFCGTPETPASLPGCCHG